MTTGIIWIVIGIILIISELLATSIVAVFLGVGALVTGILFQLGVISAFSSQLIVFSVVSIATLLLARNKLKTWFIGFTKDQTDAQSKFQEELGERVTVHKTFEGGAGRVVLNGVQWDARSEDELEKGDVAWVVSHDGIHLTVSKQKIK
ncbi:MULTISPECIES: NfeD family protein [Gammaproteobacteria]|uniref:NfeD family protein n=1 Tax=Gammaproteobacteria TaxID=1236 RepID=UPI000DD039D8|nr:MULTISPECIES: NfeD family protein [Gammaproteobacteria]RTE87236.1 NfeD family protein [Aliidiomarina sp. B3213]TCZ92977.1 NfeD family protein [Lysobacter sp. N42]